MATLGEAPLMELGGEVRRAGGGARSGGDGGARVVENRDGRKGGDAQGNSQTRRCNYGLAIWTRRSAALVLVRMQKFEKFPFPFGDLLIS